MEEILAERNVLVEGKAKKLVTTDKENLVIQHFKDKDKGVVNNIVASALFTYLSGYNIPTHFVKKSGEREMLVKRSEMIPVVFVMRNVAAGSYCKRNSLKEGEQLEKPILEFFEKNGAKNNVLIAEDEIYSSEYANEEEVITIKKYLTKMNAVLKSYLSRRSVKLVDFKVEFGRVNGKVILADEVSADTCRLWDISSKNGVDKDRFNFEKGDIQKTNQEILNRLV